MNAKIRILNAAVIVSALGYFVDIYDLTLFSIVRVPSLKSLGFDGDLLFQHGVHLINMQMLGMLLGGILWGILGDKRGRLSVLFGSILLYSVANLANAQVHSIEAYSVWRFIAGVGLAGELGAGITLVSEVLPRELRGWGTTLVASFGICGAVFGGEVASSMSWRTAYSIGGVMGLLLLLLRVQVVESGMFSQVRTQTLVARGNFLALFSSASRLAKYLRCILIGLPVWFVIGILITFAPEFAKAFGVSGEVTGGKAIEAAYIGLAIGDLTSGVISQVLRSRRKVVLAFLALTAAGIVGYLNLHEVNATTQYLACGLLGFGVGYWAIFVTIGAEQFGTNLRATVTTTVPNFVRGAVVPLTLSFKAVKDAHGILPAAYTVGFACVAIALLALWGMEETFHKDLDYIEGSALGG